MLAQSFAETHRKLHGKPWKHTLCALLGQECCPFAHDRLHAAIKLDIDICMLLSSVIAVQTIRV